MSNPTESNRLKHKAYKNKLTKIIRQHERDHYRKLLEQKNNDARHIWKVYSSIMNKNRKQMNKINELLWKGNVVKDNSIADVFNEYFCTVGTDLAKTFTNNSEYKSYLTDQHEHNMFLTPVDEVELKEEINKLKTGKSPGIDGIPSVVLKATAEFITEPLTHIFNSSFMESTVPKTLKTAKIIPIYKKDEKNKPGNYRPISLLSIFNKLLEKLMYKRLYSFFTKYNLFNKYQFGFRKNYSTTLALIEIIDKVRKELDNGNNAIGIYLDLTKAFDLVNHDILLYKLNYYGVRGQTLKAV